jgi:hypothetical protein
LKKWQPSREVPQVWKIDELEHGESVLAVAPILAAGPDFTCRLVLSDRRLMTIRSPYFASILGLARFAHSRIETSIRLHEVKPVAFTGGSSGLVRIETRYGARNYVATGIGSRWLRLLAAQISIQIGLLGEREPSG